MENNEKNVIHGNSIMTIHPYKDHGVWVFDDSNTGLVKEAFVSGADDVMDYLADELDVEPETGFSLLFSALPFPGYQHKAEHFHEEFGGNWYRFGEVGIEGWLCPSLFKYFVSAPKEIYLQAKKID